MKRLVAASSVLLCVGRLTSHQKRITNIRTTSPAAIWRQ